MIFNNDKENKEVNPLQKKDIKIEEIKENNKDKIEDNKNGNKEEDKKKEDIQKMEVGVNEPKENDGEGEGA